MQNFQSNIYQLLSHKVPPVKQKIIIMNLDIFLKSLTNQEKDSLYMKLREEFGHEQTVRGWMEEHLSNPKSNIETRLRNAIRNELVYEYEYIHNVPIKRIKRLRFVGQKGVDRFVELRGY